MAVSKISPCQFKSVNMFWMNFLEAGYIQDHLAKDPFGSHRSNCPAAYTLCHFSYSNKKNNIAHHSSDLSVTIPCTSIYVAQREDDLRALYLTH